MIFFVETIGKYKWLTTGKDVAYDNFFNEKESVKHLKVASCMTTFLGRSRAYGAKWWGNLCSQRFHFVCMKRATIYYMD